MFRTVLSTLAALACLAAVPASAQAGKENWDGLVKVKAKRLDLVYLQPDADFRGYTKVMIDPTQVAFRKNWQQDQNRSTTLSYRVSDEKVREILDAAQAAFQKYFAEAYQKAGYEIVTHPGSDVLRLSTGVVNLDVAAPDVMGAGRRRVYSNEAGQATLVLEARDSVSGALLGRAVDQQYTSDAAPYIRNSVTNMADFEQLFESWAKASAKGLDTLKSLSPINTAGLQKK
jgi:hypothetical protein